MATVGVRVEHGDRIGPVVAVSTSSASSSTLLRRRCCAVVVDEEHVLPTNPRRSCELIEHALLLERQVATSGGVERRLVDRRSAIRPLRRRCAMYGLASSSPRAPPGEDDDRQIGQPAIVADLLDRSKPDIRADAVRRRSSRPRNAARSAPSDRYDSYSWPSSRDAEPLAAIVLDHQQALAPASYTPCPSNAFQPSVVVGL